MDVGLAIVAVLGTIATVLWLWWSEQRKHQSNSPGPVGDESKDA